MTTDIEIARAAKPQNINKIAEKLGLVENDIGSSTNRYNILII